MTNGALTCRGHFTAERRERRRPAEASPLCQTRRWTRLFRKFTVAARERQAATRGAAPLAPRPPLDAEDLGHSPSALSRLLRGVASRDQPQERPCFASVPRRWTRLFLGVGHGSLPFAATAQGPTGRLRRGSASLRLYLGVDPWACGSPVAPFGKGGVSLVLVEAVASREPHRRQVRRGSPGRLSRFLGIEPASQKYEAPPACSPHHERRAYAYRKT